MTAIVYRSSNSRLQTAARLRPPSYCWRLVVLLACWMVLASTTTTTTNRLAPSSVVGFLPAVLQVVSAVKVNPRHCSGSVRHVHLAVGRRPNDDDDDDSSTSTTSMIVSFASIPSRFEPPVGGVLIGTSPDQMLDVHLEESSSSSPQNQQKYSSSPTFYNVTVEHERWSNNLDGSDGTYWSPFYHHVTITGLKPSTTYYYQPLIRSNKQAFSKYNLRQHHPSHQDEIEWEKALKDTVQQEHEDGRQDEEEEIDEFYEEGEIHGRRRRLIQWPPYDGSLKECPPMEKIRTFRTAPPKGTIGANFAILGDLGQFPHSEELMTSLLRRGSSSVIDASVLAGDIAYTGTDHRRWDTFFDFFDDYPFFEKIPMHIVPGNHDIDKLEWSNELFLAYENRFRMPRVKPPQLGLYAGPEREKLNMDQPPYPLPYEWGNAYYSWQYAGAYFVMISSYSSMEPNSTQYKWIVEELETASSEAQRETTPWLIVVLHTPIYNTFSLHLHDPQIVAAKKHLEPLFLKYQVNVVFSGHIHAYLRTNHVAMGQVVDIYNNNQPNHHRGAPMHITVGAGGRKCEAPFRSAEPEDWVAVRDATVYGYGMFRIHNRTTAEWDWIHTGLTDNNRTYNQLWKSTEQLPAGPAVDHVYIQNQYYL